jgi:hypothetical protein
MKHIKLFEQFINEFGPLAGSGNVRANDLENIKRDAARKSERGETVYVVGGKHGSYKLSKYFEKGNTYAAYYNGMPQVVEGELVNEVSGAKPAILIKLYNELSKAKNKKSLTWGFDGMEEFPHIVQFNNGLESIAHRHEVEPDEYSLYLNDDGKTILGVYDLNGYSEELKTVKDAIEWSRANESVNEDMGMVVDVAMGVAVGLMGLWALVQGAPVVSRVFGDTADYLASKAEKKAKMAMKNQRKETIAPIIKKFEGDTRLAQMYQALPDYVEFTGKNHNANLTAAKARKKGLMEIGNYIKSKLTPEEMAYFRDISAMLRDGDLKESILNEAEVTNAVSIKQILKNSFRFKKTPRGGMLGIPLANNNNDDIQSNPTAMQGISNLVNQLKNTKEMNIVSVLQPRATDIEFTVKTDTATYTVNLSAGSVRNSLVSNSQSFWMLLDSIKKSK